MTFHDSSPRSDHSRPFRQFVLKVHSLCDLACDHCYVYEHADQTWRDRPRIIHPDTVRLAAVRIAEHARLHSLDRVEVVLHGGEPLLAGPTRLRELLTVLRDRVTATAELTLRMQTNGIRLTEELCELLLEFGVQVGVSLNGDRVANDRHRRYRNGAGSYEQTVRGLELLRRPRYRPLYAGLLCTVDVENDPIDVYEALLAQEPPRLDLLLPHATWERRPPHAVEGTTPYADWLLRIHERWLADGRPVPIRLFDSLHATASGGASATEAVGVDRGEVVVIETDGAWEQPDSMKTAFHGAAGTSLTVADADADEVLRLPAFRDRQAGIGALSAICRACPFVRQCGGGLYAHRYRSGSGFDNPSVYCEDLKELIGTVNARVPPSPAPGPGPAFDDLAAGAGGVAHLVDAQESVNRALLVSVSAMPASTPDDELADEAWPLLGELDKTEPGALRRVLMHPFVRAWAVRCLRSSAGRERLADLAAAAIVACGMDAEVLVAPRDGVVHLPTVGTVVLPDPAVTRAVVSGDGTVRWRGGHLQAAAMHSPRRVAIEDGPTLLIEDRDPYRDVHDWPAAAPLADAAARGWADAVAAAWRELLVDAPEDLPGLVAGLTTIVPLERGPELRSATSRHAFGAVGIAAVDDPAVLAVLLVHEFQHTKLGALLDGVDLVDPAFAGLTAVGWRPDPRPPDAVLQGAYAHLAVAGIWRRRADRGVAQAAERFAMYRRWTLDAVRALQIGGTLTPIGQRFIDRMAETLDQWS